MPTQNAGMQSRLKFSYWSSPQIRTISGLNASSEGYLTTTALSATGATAVLEVHATAADAVKVALPLALVASLLEGAQRRLSPGGNLG